MVRKNLSKRPLSKRTVVLGIAALLLVCMSQATKAKTGLLAFSSPHCGPCQELKPTIQRLIKEGYPIRKIDVTREPQLAQRFRVDRVPCLVMVADGEEIDRLNHGAPIERLHKMFHAAGVRAVKVRELKWEGENVIPVAPQTVESEPPRTLDPPPADAQVDTDAFQQRLLASSVRIIVDDDQNKSYGTGTIVDTREGDALIVTCGHLFREESQEGRITIEIFESTADGLRVVDRLPGKLESFDLDRDVGLISFRTRRPVPVAQVAEEFGEQVNDRVWSVGCDLGADPTVRKSRVTAIDRYHGPPNVETTGAPVVGRSGGGLFNERGQLVGVCFAADEEGDEGLYSGLASVHAELDGLGLQNVYVQEGHRTPEDSPARMTPLPDSPPPVEHVAQEDKVIRGQGPDAVARQSFPSTPSRSPSAALALPRHEQAALQEIARRASDAEIVVIVRPREPGGESEVIKLDRVSPQFVEALRELPVEPARGR
ncbi:MAG: trypsin-like peptidase domain-containing protein [Aeoliella sp.]